MSDESSHAAEPDAGSTDVQNRRMFLHGLGKWSGAAVTAAVAGGFLATAPNVQGASWINRRGVAGPRRGSWINRPGGAGWINRPGGWINRPGSWVNGRVGGGSWINRW